MARWSADLAPTAEQKRALLWLRVRGGDGSFENGGDGRLKASGNGERSPFVNGIWASLDLLGLVAIRERKVTLTRAGKALEIDVVSA
jgi:hypothetical protein